MADNKIISRYLGVACHGLVYSPKDNLIYVTSSNKIFRYNAVDMKLVKDAVHKEGLSIHTADIRVLQLTTKNDKLVSAGLDHQVVQWERDTLDLHGLVTRTNGAVFDVALNGSETHMAVGGLEAFVRIVDLREDAKPQYSRFDLQGHTSSVKCVRFDPKNEFLASVSCDGDVRVWKSETKTCVHVKSHFLPIKDVEESLNDLQVAWHPKGHLMALPGTKDIVCIERGSWKQALMFKGGHAKPVSVLEFSPNGQYLASVGLDLTVNVWDVRSRQVVRSHVLESECHALVWHPSKNTVFVAEESGAISKWDDVIPATLGQPFGAVVEKQPQREKMPAAFMDSNNNKKEKEEEDVERKASQGVTTASGGDTVTKGKHKRKLLKGDAASKNRGDPTKQSKLEDDGGEGDDLVGDDPEEDLFGEDLEDFKEADELLESRAALDAIMTTGAASHGLPRVEPFQPSSTTQLGVRFMVWNEVGSVVKRPQPTTGSDVLEVEFNDKSNKMKRVPDFFGFKMCALNEKGLFCASADDDTKNRGRKKKNKSQSSSDNDKGSVLHFIPFHSPYSNSDWTLHLSKGEMSQVVASGSTWVATATSRRFVRVFSHTGAQIHMFMCPGQVITMVGSKNFLAVFYQSGFSTSFEIININTFISIASGVLPLSPQGSISWVGFATEANSVPTLYVVDDYGLMIGFFFRFSRWVPLFDTSTVSSVDEAVWPISVVYSKLLYVVCPFEDGEPNPDRRPITQATPLSVPVVESTTAVPEGELLRLKMEHSQQIKPNVATNNKKVDALTLKLIRQACATDKLAHALYLIKTLHSVAALRFAMRVAEMHSHSDLAERIAQLASKKQQQQQQQSPSPRQATPQSRPQSVRKQQRTPQRQAEPKKTPKLSPRSEGKIRLDQSPPKPNKDKRIKTMDRDKKDDDDEEEEEYQGTVEEKTKKETNKEEVAPLFKPLSKRKRLKKPDMDDADAGDKHSATPPRKKKKKKKATNVFKQLNRAPSNSSSLFNK